MKLFMKIHSVLKLFKEKSMNISMITLLIANVIFIVYTIKITVHLINCLNINYSSFVLVNQLAIIDNSEKSFLFYSY